MKGRKAWGVTYIFRQATHHSVLILLKKIPRNAHEAQLLFAEISARIVALVPGILT